MWFECRLLRLQPSGIHSSTMGFGPSILRLFAETFVTGQLVDDIPI